MKLRSLRIAHLVTLVTIMLVSNVSPQQRTDDFWDGCCVSPSIPRPRPNTVSEATVPSRTLLRALHCATTNPFMDGADSVAASLGDKRALRVAYFFGRYMWGEESRTLTVAIYSADGRRGWLFDMDWEGRKYYVQNLPELRKASKHWRVGEIQGGIWSYTRLWYLAQEVGSRPRQSVPVTRIIRSDPESCTAMGIESRVAQSPPA
jgi:hypothetical protein